MPLRPLAVGEILDGAIATIRRHPKITLGLSALVVSVETLLSVLVQALAGGLPLLSEEQFDSTSFSWTPVAIGTAGGLLALLISAVMGALLAGMITVVVSESVLGRDVTAAGVWARVRPLAVPLVGASVLAGLLPFLGLVAFIVGGVFLWGALALTTPALVLERLGVRAALRRSWRLVLPDWWRIFGIRLLSVVIAGVVSSIVVTPFAIAGVFTMFTGIAGGLLGFAVITLAGALASIVTEPFTSAVLTLLYVDRRMRAEALDLALAAAVAGPRPPSW